MRSLFGRSPWMLMIYAQSVAQWRSRSGSFPVHTHLAGEYHVRQKWLVHLYFCVRLIVFWICFCTLCFCFPTKMRHLNVHSFPLKFSVVFKKVIKCSENQWEAFSVILNVLRGFKANENICGKTTMYNHVTVLIEQKRIFYTSDIASVFVFRSCISRHLMNNKECFFCKSAVNGMEDISTEAGSKKQ